MMTDERREDGKKERDNPTGEEDVSTAEAYRMFLGPLVGPKAPVIWTVITLIMVLVTVFLFFYIQNGASARHVYLMELAPELQLEQAESDNAAAGPGPLAWSLVQISGDEAADGSERLDWVGQTGLEPVESPEMPAGVPEAGSAVIVKNPVTLRTEWSQRVERVKAEDALIVAVQAGISADSQEHSQWKAYLAGSGVRSGLQTERTELALAQLVEAAVQGKHNGLPPEVSALRSTPSYVGVYAMGFYTLLMALMTVFIVVHVRQVRNASGEETIDQDGAA